MRSGVEGHERVKEYEVCMKTAKEISVALDEGRGSK